MAEYANTFGKGGFNSLVDADELLSECGIDRDEIAWRKEFIGFDEEDARRLSSMEDLFEAHADEVADKFYENLTQYEQTTSVIERSDKHLDQLKETQRAYLVTLASGEYGKEYFANRARIGKIHDLLEMPMKQYVGQYGVYYDLIFSLFSTRARDDLVESLAAASEPSAEDDDQITLDRADLERIVSHEVEESVRDMLAVLRIINLDMQVVADTYIHSYNQRLEEATEAQKRLMQEVETDVEQPIADLNESAGMVADSAERVSTLATDQVDRIERVTGEVSTMSATVEEIASTASQVEAKSKEAERLARSGQESADATGTAIDDIGTAIAEVSEELGRLQKRVDEIDEVVEMINEIADQTNMLALNASIEAARAGEAGEGFAVVADEVKGLAEQSREHASEIETMVEQIKSETDQSVSNLETATERVDEGIDRVDDTTESLADIVTAVTETREGIEEVSSATDDQANSAEEIARLLDDVVTQAEDVAEEVESVAAVNEQQKTKIQQIEQTVRKLTDSISDE